MKYNLADLSYKQLFIFGLGKEGYSTYTFLRKHFPDKKIILVDDKPLDTHSGKWQEAAQNPYSSFTSPEAIEKHNLENAVLFKTPGIPPSHPFLKQAHKNKVKISSNTNFFFRIVEQLNQDRQQLITIGVTGTKGKSTTTAVIHHLLKTAHKDVALGGNIGLPPLDLLTDKPAKILVLELSSHQLRDLQYSPHFAVIQEITPEHLDYYPDFKSYWQAKSQITQFQTEDDYVIYNPIFEISAKIAHQSKAVHLTVGSTATGSLKPVSFVKHNALYHQSEEIIDLNELPLKGKHNILNVLPAIVVARQMGVAATDVRQGLQTFKPLEHRLEEITASGNTIFVNDSLSTTPEATIAAMRSYPNKKIVLIAGGYDRNQDFSKLAKDILAQNVAALFYFSPTGDRLTKAINQLSNGSKPTLEKVESMDEAVSKAIALADNNTVVLLSPASASFGRFKDYSDRGNQFKQAVQKYT